MTSTPPYCEGCEAVDEPLSAKGYCPKCTEVACGAGNGEYVGLPAVPEYDVFQVKLAADRLLTVSSFARGLARLTKTCSECDRTAGAMSRTDLMAHVFGPRNTVLIACEGYQTSFFRAAHEFLVRGR